MTSPANPTQYQTPDKLKSKKKARKDCETESPRSKNGSSAMLRNLRRLGSTVKVRKIGASLRRVCGNKMSEESAASCFTAGDIGGTLTIYAHSESPTA
ncbi:hypothetical protein AAMO2058_000158700 [Amorphochlora amoebiformis]